MHNDQAITFQLATHYLPKISLRVETLYQRIQDASVETHPAIHLSACMNVLEMSKLVEKPELKSRFIKELMRLEYAYSKTASQLTEQLSLALQHQIHMLSHISSRFGEKCHQDPLLQSIRQTQSAFHQDVELDSPPLLFWLAKHPRTRQHNLVEWLEYLHPVYEASHLYLSMLRSSAAFEQVTVKQGFYQQALSSKQACYLILLRIETELGLIPKVQLGHHGLNIRLCEASSMKEVVVSDVTFDLAICQLL